MPNGKHNPEETDPETLARLLELELMQKRIGWQQAKGRRANYRTLSFLFLFLVIVAALAAGFFLMQRGPAAAGGGTSTAPTPMATPRS